jgi:hypothetical protein
MRCWLGLMSVLVSLALPAAGTAHPSLSPGAQLDRIFRLGTLYAATDERDMRHCGDPTAAIPCATAVEDVQTVAREYLVATGSIRQASLSSFGQSIRTNLLHEFQRYYLAANAFGLGNHSAYVQQLRQAITQAAAASTRLGERPSFNYTMTLARCASWQLRLRFPGENPCD